MRRQQRRPGPVRRGAGWAGPAAPWQGTALWQSPHRSGGRVTP